MPRRRRLTLLHAQEPGKEPTPDDAWVCVETKLPAARQMLLALDTMLENQGDEHMKLLREVRADLATQIEDSDRNFHEEHADWRELKEAYEAKGTVQEAVEFLLSIQRGAKTASQEQIAAAGEILKAGLR